MSGKAKWAKIFSAVVVTTMVLSACAAPTPEVVEKVVEKVVTQVVKETVVVQATPQIIEKVVTKVVEVTPEPTPAPAWFKPEYANRYGGVLHTAWSTTSPTLDTMTGMAAMTCYPGQMMFETLIAYDEGYNIAPMLAESWEASDNSRTWTFHLRKGVKFHNGKEMTSEDVKASFDRYMTPGVGVRQGQFALLESWEAIDDYTFAIHLREPSLAILGALAYPVGDLVIMPKEVIEGKKAGDLKAPTQYDPNVTHDLIGTGPYKLVEWKPDEYIRFQRNELYQPLPSDYSGLAGGKIPYFDEVYYHFVPEAQVRVGGIEIGKYDWIGDLPESEFARLKESTDVRPYTTGGAWALMILFNHANWPTSDVRFRQAVLAALDIEEVALAAAGGVPEFVRLNPSIFVPEGPWYIEDDPVAKELYNQNNPEKAKQLLAEMGYNGQEVIMVFGLPGKYERMMVAVADQLKKRVGINMTVEKLDWPGTRARWEEKETWHMSTTGYLSQVIFNPDALASFWHSKSASSERGFYANPAMDAAFETAAKALTPEDRKAAFKEVQRLYYQDLPNIKVHDYFAAEAIRTEIKGHKTWYRSNRFWGIWREK